MVARVKKDIRVLEDCFGGVNKEPYKESG